MAPFNRWYVPDEQGVYKRLRGPGKDIPPRGRSDFPFDAMIAGATLHLKHQHDKERLMRAWNAFNIRYAIRGELLSVKVDATDPDGPGQLLRIRT